MACQMVDVRYNGGMGQNVKTVLFVMKLWLTLDGP